ncbi:MAG TPA: FecR domain-containing protein [Caulobacteraceae bacterium]
MTASPAPEAETIQGQATTWFARRRSGAMTAKEAAALEAWLDADLRHRLAFEAVEALWGGFDHTRDAPEVLAMRATARKRPAPAWWRMAAGLVAALALGAGVWSGGQMNLLRSHELPNQTFRTEIGQRSTVTLPDGSVVTLNTGTVLRTRADGERRLLYLDRGQAFFKVAKDKTHPFVVYAGGRKVTAVGTAFDVRVDQGRFEVTLVEGKVRVETPLPHPARALPAAPAVETTEMVAGSQFTATNAGRWSVERADTATETAWLTGWLKFENQPLGEVVAELARYSDARIVLEDEQLAAMPVSGRFKAGDLDAFLDAVRVYDIAPIAPPRDGVVKLALKEHR